MCRRSAEIIRNFYEAVAFLFGLLRMIETKSRFAITISLHEPVLAGEYSGFKLEGVMLRNCEK